MTNDASPVYGNYEDKYNSGNIVTKILMGSFIKNFKAHLSSFGEESVDEICEVGCAEGELLKVLSSVYPQASLSATDLSAEEIAKAEKNCADFSVAFSIQDAENLEKYADAEFDLVVCCEVLEHLSHPQKGLDELFRISRKYILLSVPNEPIWRFLNMARGKYWRDFGNTPGHLNHWTVWQFPRFLRGNDGYAIIKRSYPFPWQMVLLKKVT